MRGVTLYVGTTGAGKTYAALEDLRTIPMRRVILDLGGSRLLSDIPEGSRKGPESESRLMPESAEQLDAEFQKVYREGNAALLVDDSSALPAPGLGKLCRLWRPRNLRILITTQHISGDIAQAIQACDPLIYVFRTTSPRSLEWLEKWHGVDPQEVRSLETGEALEVSF